MSIMIIVNKLIGSNPGTWGGLKLRITVASPDPQAQPAHFEISRCRRFPRKLGRPRRRDAGLDAPPAALGGTQTGSYQTGSYQKGRFIPPKPFIMVHALYSEYVWGRFCHQFANLAFGNNPVWCDPVYMPLRPARGSLMQCRLGAAGRSVRA